MYAWALQQRLEVPDPEADLAEPEPRPAGKLTRTARLQPKGVPARSHLRPVGGGAGTPLSAEVARAAAVAFGEDFSGVRVHQDGQADALGVRAFAVGEDLHFATGAYAPDTRAGRELLGHELTHVRQQRAGRVGGGQPDAVEVVIDAGLEAEADRGGERLAGLAGGFDLEAFLAGPTAPSSTAQAPVATHAPATAQAKDAPATAATGASTRSTGADTWTAGTIPVDAGEALARWQKGYDRFARVYQWGLALKVEAHEGEPSRETLFRNTCEWIRDGHAKVCLVAPVEAARQDPNQGTCFDVGLHYPRASPNPQRTSPDWDPANFYGFYERSNDTLSLVDVGADRWDDHTIIGTMIHEVQHDADSGPGDSTYPDTDLDFSMYKSEFRAWWIDPIDGPAMGDPSVAAPAGAVVSAPDPAVPGGPLTSMPVIGFGNERQHGIFMNLAQTPDPNNPSVYDYVAERFVFDRAFRAMVTAYTTPVGGNLLNSVRIEALVQLVVGSGTFAAIRAYAHDDLEAADRDFLLDKARAADFWSMARGHLPARYVSELEAAIRTGGKAAAPADGKYQYTVVAGDTLSLIAGRLLGDPMRYPDICALPENPQSIRDNPDLIEPGLTLWIPGA